MPGTRTSIAGVIAIAASAFTLAAPAAAGAAEPRIIKGQDADIADYPYQVHLDIEGRDGEYGCGGSIINATTVVTAAHCVKDDASSGGTDGPVNPRYLTVGYGSAEISELKTVGVKEVTMPKAYPGNFSFDVARLDLAAPLEGYGVDPAVDQIPLVDASDLTPAIDAEDNVFVSGWGNTTNNGEGSETLKFVALPLRDDSECDDGGQAYIAAFALCIGGKGMLAENNPDSCQGDSGGPAALEALSNPADPSSGKDYLAGIVAFGDECGKFETAGAYTDVTNPNVRAVINGTFPEVFRGSASPLYPQDIPAQPVQQPQGPPAVTTGVRPVQPVQVKDTVKPTLRLSKTSCKKGGRCTLRLAAADNSGDINETQFKVTRKVKKCKRVKGKRKCKKVTERAALKEKNVKGGIEVSVKLKKGTWQFSGVVLDDADNKSVTVKKTIRVKR